MKYLLAKLGASYKFLAPFCPSYDITYPGSLVGSQRFLENRLPVKNKRFSSMLFALELLDRRGARVLVETGTARDGVQNFEGDGGSTVIFADWANQNGAKFYSVDISPKAVENAKKVVSRYAQNVEVVCADSIKYLAAFEQPIDFLYLDSYDFNKKDPLPSQCHHLCEIEAVYPKLHKNSVVMIDDCGLPHGGKGKLIIHYLLDKGWSFAFKGYQIIMTKTI